MSSQELQFLLDVAEPEIYRRNAFRILRLSVEASAREVKRQYERIRLKSKLSGLDGDGEDLLSPILTRSRQDSMNLAEIDLSLFPDVGIQEAREAFQRVNDPSRRLIDEFFWFWPDELGRTQEDKALEAINREDINAAANVWRAREREHTAQGQGVSTHNLAVLHHMAVLDMELSAIDEQLSSELIYQRDSLWQECFARWKRLIHQPKVWERLTRRVRALDDPRLSDGVAEQIRSTLPVAILLINVKLAVAAGERGKIAETERHADLIDASGFDQRDIQRAKVLGVKDLRARIQTACRLAEDGKRKNPVHADGIAKDLLNNTTLALALAVIDKLFPQDHPTRMALHDELALQVFSALIAFGNHTESWETAIPLLERALQIAESETAKSRIRKGLSIARDNAESDFRWKTPGYYELPESLHNDLERARQYADLQKWDHAIGILERLYQSNQGESHLSTVAKPLSLSLFMRAQQRLNEAFRGIESNYGYISEYRRNQIREAVRYAERDLARAHEVDPSNKTIASKYDQVRSLAYRIGVTVPARRAYPSRRPASTRRPQEGGIPPAQPRTKGGSRNRPLVIVLFALAGIWLLIKGCDPGPGPYGPTTVPTRPTSTVSSRKTPTRTPFQVPTFTSPPGGGVVDPRGRHCIRWDRVTQINVGQTICVYGTVLNVKPGGSVYTIEFSHDWYDFKIQDFNHYWLDIQPGECILAIGRIRDNVSFLILTPDRDNPEIYGIPASSCRR